MQRNFQLLLSRFHQTSNAATVWQHSEDINLQGYQSEIFIPKGKVENTYSQYTHQCTISECIWSARFNSWTGRFDSNLCGQPRRKQDKFASTSCRIASVRCVKVFAMIKSIEFDLSYFTMYCRCIFIFHRQLIDKSVVYQLSLGFWPKMEQFLSNCAASDFF